MSTNTEEQFDKEFDIELITKSIVDKLKSEVHAKYGNKKRHRQ
jgi:hypothetical protein